MWTLISFVIVMFWNWLQGVLLHFNLKGTICLYRCLNLTNESVHRMMVFEIYNSYTHRSTYQKQIFSCRKFWNNLHRNIIRSAVKQQALRLCLAVAYVSPSAKRRWGQTSHLKTYPFIEVYWLSGTELLFCIKVKKSFQPGDWVLSKVQAKWSLFSTKFSTNSSFNCLSVSTAVWPNVWVGPY